MTRILASVFSAALLFVAAPRALAQVPAAVLAKLGSDSVEERRAAARTLTSLGSRSDMAPSIARQLEELRRVEDGRVAPLVGDVRSRAPKDSDLVELLIAQRPDGAAAEAITVLCLVRALARIGTTQAVREIVSVASDAGGAFRPELLRELRQLDERATAALIEARSDPSPALRGWAQDVLEALGKRTPGDAVQTTNDQVLADVLRAYALSRDPDALPVVFSFINSERAQVRSVAREALLAYGEDAWGRLRTTFAALTGRKLPDGLDSAAAARQLFEAYDRYRLREVYARLDEGLGKLARGELEEAVRDFDEVLARQPTIDRRAETVPAYVRYAEKVEGSDPQRALDYFSKALRLDETGPSAQHVQSELQLLEAEDLIARGVDDIRPFEQALALDPANERARARVEHLRASSAEKRKREGAVAAAVAAVGLSLVGVGLLALRAQRARTR